MTLIGEHHEGFHIFEKRVNKSERPIATCQVSHTEIIAAHSPPSDEHCFTMHIVKLEEMSEIFVMEFSNNSGVHYLKDSTYFGLIKIG